ncbi:MAG: helix-turn-helix transcriptional regulator [Nitrospinae bacterium]|nr:helix-turn-helix transcriptional regulator [Nitrospinota bacterium]
MSILARNLKTIRKELKCTQSAMSDILKVGFRTYVRYEAGERDAPVSVLVKIARLGNVSLERLLTAEIRKFDLLPLQTVPPRHDLPEVKTCNFGAGQIVFKKPACQGIVTVDDSERKILSLFRRMDPHTQAGYLEDLGKSVKGMKRGVERGPLVPAGKRVEKATRSVPEIAVSKAPAGSASQPKRKGRPGRKKLDKKLLKEQIDKLKLITKSINKITVR